MLSSGNWNRPEQEITALMTLFMQALDLEVKKLHQNNIRLKIIGDTSRFTVKVYVVKLLGGKIN